MHSSFARIVLAAAFGTVIAACSGATAPNDEAADAAASSDSGSDSAAATVGEAGSAAVDAALLEDAAAPATIGPCKGGLGAALTASFGRIDGMLTAMIVPNDQACMFPNRDHLQLQVSMAGKDYRFFVNVHSDRGPDYDVRLARLAHALPAPAFAEGWHTDAPLDYVATLGVHSADAANSKFAPVSLDEATKKIAGAVTVGQDISVYATSGPGRPESAHLIHRNGANDDGAIVIGPKSASPEFLVFHFSTQTF